MTASIAGGLCQHDSSQAPLILLEMLQWAEDYDADTLVRCSLLHVVQTEYVTKYSHTRSTNTLCNNTLGLQQARWAFLLSQQSD